MDNHFEKLREADFKSCYVFESKPGQEMVPNLRKNTQSKLVLRRIPKIKPSDLKDIDY